MRARFRLTGMIPIPTLADEEVRPIRVGEQDEQMTSKNITSLSAAGGFCTAPSRRWLTTLRRVSKIARQDFGLEYQSSVISLMCRRRTGITLRQLERARHDVCRAWRECLRQSGSN